jgi:hypothetical protein
MIDVWAALTGLGRHKIAVKIFPAGGDPIPDPNSVFSDANAIFNETVQQEWLKELADSSSLADARRFSVNEAILQSTNSSRFWQTSIPECKVYSF